MKRALVAAALATLASCTTNPVTGESEANWPVVEAEFKAIAGDPDIPGDRGDLGELADLIETRSPTSAADWNTFREAVQAVGVGVSLASASGEVGGLAGVAEIALEAADALAQGIDDPDTKFQVQASLFVVKAALRRVRIYALADEQEAPEPEPEAQPVEVEEIPTP